MRKEKKISNGERKKERKKERTGWRKKKEWMKKYNKDW